MHPCNAAGCKLQSRILALLHRAPGGYKEQWKGCGTDLLEQRQCAREQVPLHIDPLRLDGTPALAAPEVLEHLFQEQQAPIAGSLAEALLDGLCCQALIGCQDLRVQVGVSSSESQELRATAVIQQNKYAGITQGTTLRQSSSPDIGRCFYSIRFRLCDASTDTALP